MSHYIRYELQLDEPLRMGRQGSQSNTESLNYITGSSVRGAVIGKCIQEWCPDYHGDISKNAEYAGILFHNTRFFDAYIACDGRPSIPVPAVYYADKHKIRDAQREMEAKGIYKFAVHSCSHIGEFPMEGEQRVDAEQYCTLTDKRIFVKSVKKTANIHIALAKNDENSKMFRYEAIDRNQLFIGYIRCHCLDEVDKIRQVMQRNNVLYLGGSKGSGYGRCRIQNAKVYTWEDTRSELVPRQDIHEGELTVYALSNLILTDEWGKPTGQISESYLAERLGLKKVKLEGCYLSVIKTSGYNHTWRARQVQQTAVKSGSVYLFSYEGKLDRGRLQQLEEEGIGSRKTEGFGRVLLNLPMSQTVRSEWEEGKTDDEPAVLTSVEKLKLQSLAEQICQKRWDNVMGRTAYEIADRSRSILKDFSLTQISSLYSLLYNILISQTDNDTAKQSIQNYIENDISRKSKDSYQWAVLKMNEYKKWQMKELIDELMDDSVAVSSWNCGLKWDNEQLFDGISVEEPCPFRQKCRLLCAVLYNLMRMEGGRA